MVDDGVNLESVTKQEASKLFLRDVAANLKSAGSYGFAACGTFSFASTLFALDENRLAFASVLGLGSATLFAAAGFFSLRMCYKNVRMYIENPVYYILEKHHKQLLE